MTKQYNIIIAGSTGLIGSHLVNNALKHEQIENIISLSRHPLEQCPNARGKLTQVINDNLLINETFLPTSNPSIGFITLGSTKKKAGSKEALKAVDVTLVVSVAKEMKQIGVKSIYIVSCIGASASAASHYLKCKGEMELEIEALGFERTVFVQPGPLAGLRKEPRSDDRLLQGLMKVISPIMKGKLLNYKPIEAEFVANAMLHLALENQFKKGVQRVTSKEIFALHSSL